MSDANLYNYLEQRPLQSARKSSRKSIPKTTPPEINSIKKGNSALLKGDKALNENETPRLQMRHLHKQILNPTMKSVVTSQRN